MEKILLRFDEVMEMLNISKNEIFQLLKDGKLRAYNATGEPGRGSRLLASSVYQLVETEALSPERWKE